MIRVVHCDSCGRKVGTREDLTLNIKKGCQVDIIITCANCLRSKETPRYDPKEFDNIFNGLFGRGK
jgi:sporulation protein YlmC with PRC-barrel domain